MTDNRDGGETATGPRVGTAFLPVADPAAAARWYRDTFGFRPVTIDEWSANLAGGHPGATLHRAAA